jgi:hypothetical protein
MTAVNWNSPKIFIHLEKILFPKNEQTGKLTWHLRSGKIKLNKEY